MPLSIGIVVYDSFRVITRQWRAFLCALTLPTMALTVFATIDYAGSSGWQIVALHLTFYATATLYAVTSHRIALYGSDSVPNRWGLYWTKRETIYFAVAAAIFIVPGYLITWPMFTNLPLGQYIAVQATVWLSLAYVVARLSIALPAIAIDDATSITTAWNLSRHNGWRLTIALSIPILLIAGLGFVYERLVPPSSHPIGVFLTSFAFVLVDAITITALSVAYRELRLAHSANIAGQLL